jgi:hypothetical protein
MKAIDRRLCRLEDQFGTAFESEFSRHLCELLTGRERRAGLPPQTEGKSADIQYGQS